MTLSERIFSKPITELTYSDIESYFTQARSETDLIEFKGYGSGKTIEDNFNGVHKAFCAMLNSQGGIIVWGAPYGVKATGQKEKVFQGELKPLSSVPGKDNMVNILVGNITPIPNSFKLEVIPNLDKTKSIIIIQVEKSEYAPHQFDNTYYMRIDGQTKPAPHHYVEALFKQIKYPNLAGYIKFSAPRVVKHHGTIIDIEISLWNLSPLQNEIKPKYILKVSPGQVWENFGVLEDMVLNVGRNELIQTELVDVLHYGFPYTKRWMIRYNDDVFENSKSINFNLFFGGQYSPMKMTGYILRFTDNAMNYSNPQSAITQKMENTLVVDLDTTINKKIEDYFKIPVNP